MVAVGPDDPTALLGLVTEVKESMEAVVHGERSYEQFLHFLFAVFYNLLRQGAPQFVEGPEQKVRNTVLDILNRLPTTAALQPYAANLLKLSMFLLEVENEDNAVICLRIIIDLHKNYRPMLEGDVQPFLDIVQKIYSDLPATVAAVFSAAAAAATSKPSDPSVPAKQQAPPTSAAAGLALDAAAAPPGKKAAAAGHGLIRSTQSFKVLTECPIIVVLLFQLYPRYLHANIPKFMPLIVNTLGLVAPKAALTTHRAAYVDFVAAQVKVLIIIVITPLNAHAHAHAQAHARRLYVVCACVSSCVVSCTLPGRQTLSFLAYMLRGYAEHLRPYQEQIPKCVIALLLNCPHECAAIRKVPLPSPKEGEYPQAGTLWGGERRWTDVSVRAVVVVAGVLTRFLFTGAVDRHAAHLGDRVQGGLHQPDRHAAR
jgi:transformation/transcription domain-associated protein